MANQTFQNPVRYYKVLLSFIFATFFIQPAVAGKPVGLLAPSSVVALAVSQTSINLVWNDPNSTESGYSIERKTASDANFVVIATTASNVIAYDDSGLSSGTTYEYRIQAIQTQRKGTSTSSYSAIASATTSVAVSDNTAPNVSLANPANGSSYTTPQIVALSASVSDNVGVSKVEFYDNSTLLTTDTSAPYSYDFSVDAAKNGSHSLSAKAYDTSNNSALSNTAAVTVDIDNTPPSVSITSPSGGISVTSAQTLSITASASDEHGVVKVEFSDNGVLKATDTAMPFNYDWSLTAGDNGSHTWVAKAYDAAGNQTASSPVDIMVAVAGGSGSSADLVVDNGYLGPSSALQSKGRMAEFNGLHAMLYTKGFTGQKWLYLWDEAGHESWVYLPDLDSDKVFNGDYILNAADELWIFSSNGSAAFNTSGAPAVARRYYLGGGDVLPNTATLMETQSFGDPDSAAGSFTRLQSGALVGVWYNLNKNPVTTADNWADLGFAYRSPEGVWSTVTGIRVEALPNHLHSLALAQHPGDGSIWAFSKGDSFKRIWAVHLSEIASGLRLDWVDDQYITQAQDGLDGPEDELPSLVATPDPSTGTLLLAYQNADFQIFSSSPFIKGAKVNIARIQTDGNRSFIHFPGYIERVYGLGGLVVKPDGIAMVYRPVDEQALSYNDVYVSRYVNGGWEAAHFLGTTYFGTSLSGKAVIAYDIGRDRFAIAQDDYNVHLLTLD